MRSTVAIDSLLKANGGAAIAGISRFVAGFVGKTGIWARRAGPVRLTDFCSVTVVEITAFGIRGTANAGIGGFVAPEWTVGQSSANAAAADTGFSSIAPLTIIAVGIGRARKAGIGRFITTMGAQGGSTRGAIA
jgi:hypothetical protein